MFYKLAMSSFVIFFWSGTPSQVAAAFLITLVCLVLHLFRSPYVNQELFRMQVCSISCSLVALSCPSMCRQSVSRVVCVLSPRRLC